MNANRKKAILIVAVVILGAAGALFLLRGFGLKTDASQIILYGNVDIREADLAFNITGRIDAMRVEEGDEVEEGQVLAVLETEIYDAELQAAKARVGAAKAAHDRLLAGSRPEEIEMARAEIQDIEAALEQAQGNLRRTEKLVTDDFASQQKLDDNRALVKSLGAKLNVAEQALALAIQGPRAEDIAEAAARLNAEEAGLALAAKRLTYTKLEARERGVVNTRIVEPGSVVLSNTPVYSVALVDPVWVRTYVSERDLGRIHPGMAARITTDSHPDDSYEGWVGFISPIAEFTPKTVETPEVRTSLVYRLRVFVKNPDNALRQGMPVTVWLESSNASSGDRPE